MSTILLTETKTAEETELLGFKLAKSLRPDDVVALYGELGSGKTCFVNGIARGLNVLKSVKSPSFSIINEYPGNVPLFHIDFYRLENTAEIEDIGWTEYLDSGGIVIIEWAERVKNVLPSKRIDVYFQILNEVARRLEIIAVDDSGN
ncbi:MAG: tRNA (adenosine(37)-N6)-threonylcarbamoyltransferase complex ATPase subunit type 1 TsaE [Candidatus Zixiibacteriota bacterium]|nr:MAG: tRNA (adenosine(37)-N6)-threonylcarbamoyltransferase complex ATPase subunit type 1 TsaE [candidate division Zixibacteria bacterium]